MTHIAVIVEGFCRFIERAQPFGCDWVSYSEQNIIGLFNRGFRHQGEMTHQLNTRADNS